MARRKDHSPEKLKAAIRRAAEKLIHSKGLSGLTARALAQAIGYTPGTIYNFYRDMDALVTEVNYMTLQQLHEFCVARLTPAKPGFDSIHALAYAYVDFAHENERAWRTLFIDTNRGEKPGKLPAHYKECLVSLFALIETTLQKNMAMPADKSADAARLLWACLHGITILILDGRLLLVGIENPHAMVDDLLRKYLDVREDK